VVDVAQDVGLGGKAVRPHPFLLQRVGKGVRVFQAFDVAARSGVAVPEPGSADAAAGFEDPGLPPDAAQPMQRIQAGESAADHDRIQALRLADPFGHRASRERPRLVSSSLGPPKTR
jgi:hypothetical protein